MGTPCYLSGLPQPGRPGASASSPVGTGCPSVTNPGRYAGHLALSAAPPRGPLPGAELGPDCTASGRPGKSSGPGAAGEVAQGRAAGPPWFARRNRPLGERLTDKEAKRATCGHRRFLSTGSGAVTRGGRREPGQGGFRAGSGRAARTPDPAQPHGGRRARLETAPAPEAHPFLFSNLPKFTSFIFLFKAKHLQVKPRPVPQPRVPVPSPFPAPSPVSCSPWPRVPWRPRQPGWGSSRHLLQ